ncbi:terminase large subunit [Priestia megaterium]|uniref:terminase large subunit n=1 Tax=Priestia megaterium TaxID=1404 RepID=UPI002E1C926F|nr:terminase TerL endonuclease subunit [Priestia megaterium]MED4061695.1 terminase large subunit [Priestia megaterium]
MIIKTNGYLEEYCRQVMSGEIVAGLELKMELQKLIAEMQEDRFQYDTSEADIKIKFMESLCLQSKKPYYNKPMKLLLWQKAFITALYSFKKYSDELGRWIRRFQDVILLIARKNGKTTLMAADAHCDLRIGDGGMDIVCTSNDDRQASLLWSEVGGMRKRIDPKGTWTHQNMTEISNRTNGTKIFKMSSKTQNKDGRNIDKAYFDESHDAQNDEIAAACQKSMSVKEEPMFINLTTEGFVNDGYLDNKLIYARKVLNDEVDDDTFLPWLYTQDSEQEIWQDKNTWYKSNPSLGAIKKWSYLEGEIAKSKVDKSTRMHTMCKDFNIKQNNAQAWLMTEDYDYPVEVYDLEEFRGSLVLGAVDLSATTDLSNAKIMLMKAGDNTKYVYSHYWIPESKLEASDDKEAGAKYAEWAKNGLLTIHEGNEIDISKIADWYYNLYRDYGLRLYKCGYDQRYAKTFLDRMDDYGFDCEMIYQNRFVMSGAMKLVEADLKAQVINYNQNDMDKWCLGNAAMEMDNLGNVMCVKVNNQKSKRIDGAVNLIILYEVYRRYRSDFVSQAK